MMNTSEKKFDEIKDGKYEFLIQGVVRTDTNGYELKLKTGHSYQKLRIILLTNDKNHYVYKTLFNIGDIKEVVFGIGNPALTFVFESNPEKFELENFIGEGGVLFLGHENKSGNNYTKIECFIKPKASIQPSNALIANPLQSHAPRFEREAVSTMVSSGNFSQELDDPESTPF